MGQIKSQDQAKLKSKETEFILFLVRGAVKKNMAINIISQKKF